MKQKFQISIRGIITIGIACVIAYYILLCPNIMHSSIAEITDYLNNLAMVEHLLVLGLLPIYIAAIVFGALLVGIFLSLLVQNLITKPSKN